MDQNIHPFTIDDFLLGTNIRRGSIVTISGNKLLNEDYFIGTSSIDDFRVSLTKDGSGDFLLDALPNVMLEVRIRGYRIVSRRCSPW